MKVEVSGITKQFGHSTALADVSLEFPSGELVALLGPSGSGKTTLLRILAGIETPDRGTVRFGSDDVTRRPIRERGIGFVFQNYALFEHMTVFDNIGFGLKVRGTPAAKIARRVKDLLQLVQLPGLGDRLPAQLSGGQRQRIALARALAPEPKVLLLDEPFGALDARVRRDLRTWLRKLHDEIHVTSVFVTHDQDEAFEVADRVVIMNDGQVEQIGDPQSLTSAPKTSFVREFLSAVARPAAAALESCRISPVAVRSEAA